MSLLGLLGPAGLALALEGVSAAMLHATARAYFAGSATTTAPAVRPPGLLIALFVGGVVAWGMALLGLWRLHRTVRPLVAILLTLFVYGPVVLVAIAQVVALLVITGAW